jgi:hypothetical protein
VCVSCVSLNDHILLTAMCSNCGKVVCGSCSSKKARLSKLKTEKAVRVCTFCYNWLHTKEGEGTTTLTSPPFI